MTVLAVARKAEDEIEIIRKALTPVSSPRFFHFVMPKGKDWVGITIGAVMSALAFFFTVGGFYDGSTESLIAGLILFSYPFYVLGALISACFPTGIEMAIRNLRDTTLKAKQSPLTLDQMERRQNHLKELLTKAGSSALLK